VERLDLTQFASAIERGVDGIWRSPEAEPISYPADGNEACFAVEENSFWFTHRNAVIGALIGRYRDELEGAPFADIGGGNGFVALAAEALGIPTLLVEPGPQGARRAYDRGLASVVEGTLDSCQFRDGCLAGAGMFDVVEHIADDVGFLRETRRALRPGGLLFVSVPAYPLLWSHEDTAAGHERRYTAASMSRLLSDAGFEQCYLGHFFRPLPPLIGLLRALPYRLGLAPAAPTAASVARDHKPGVADRAIRALIAGEVAAVARGEELAFGGSILVAARRSR
jgi:SAM-dependent methyltransferase